MPGGKRALLINKIIKYGENKESSNDDSFLVLGFTDVSATVKSIENTANIELNFDSDYHKKYIGLTGDTIPHNLKPGRYKNHVCLGFNPDKDGRYQDVDWFNMYDLEL